MEDFYNRIAQRKYNLPKEWAWFSNEAVEGGFIIIGGIISEDNKGKRTWAKPHKKILISIAEIKEEKDLYEFEEGNCSNCFGKGEVFKSWSVDEGVKNVECRKCEGTGRP
ncbi:hypothetical protein JWG44_05560 [Leptospira sp. 201903071]|uniref:hypothetical protein n=1 Tax=Leptospira ainazelensis TaxID=2810034 RepID=UPI001963E446|nr:hypothetical protein [Leptospira ainazelensis]MBM9499717.1 hypothetical protein [Leptospira ainazelensis]